MLKSADFSKQFSQSGGNVRHAFRDKVSSFERIAQFTDVDGNKIDILIVNLKRDSTIERGRTSLRNFAADYLQSDRGLGKAAVLAAYVSASKRDWRFSYITLEKSLVKQENGRFKETITTLTPARRFSFLVGEEEKTHTAQRQFFNLLQSQSAPTLRQIEEAFSIEKVTDEFYKDYEKLYRRLEKEIEILREEDSKLDEHLKDNFIENADFSKKLLGQIVFLYFLQKKGWFGVDRGAEWGSGNKKFLRYLFEHRAKLGTRQERVARKGVNFFNDILEHLFYDALARNRDDVDDYYARFDCKIPFLNGGLFEAAYKWEAVDVLLPDELFSNSEPTKGGDKGTGILDVFDRYNFTVNEAEPLEKDVAVDPEMLGKVFENLLPENERKGKGSFYTPRQIVNYMCQQSLISYIATHLPGVPRADIETFIHIGDFQSAYEAAGTKRHEENFLPESISKNAARIDELLEDIAVCDPAIGSGAFPVGMMQEIVRARSSLTDTLDSAKSNKSKSEREWFERSRSAYELKRHVIQTSLYGVDIDPGAVEIAKLRLWLSLVVDEDERERVQALPNLDYKIMQGNALLDEFAGVRLIDDAMFEKPVVDIEAERAAIQQRIRELEGQLYALHRKGAEARALKRKFSKETNRLIKQSKELTQPKAAENVSLLPDDPYREARDTLDEIRRQIDEYFSLTSPVEKRAARAHIERLEWRFMEQTLTARDEQNALKELALHRRDNRKPYFLWKLYFSDVFQGKGGFDVVIGNPPYVRADSGEEHLAMRKAIEQSGTYKTLWEKWDLYVAMIERGYQILRPGGIISFIVSDAYSHSKYAQKSQKWFLQNSRVLRLDFLGKLQIFDAAVRNIIFFFQKEDGAKNEPERRVHEGEFGDVTLLPTTSQEELTYRAFFPEDVQTMTYDVPMVSLRDVCYVSKGMVVHADEKDARGEFELSDLVTDKKDRLHPKPFVEGKYLARWLPTTNNWLEWNTYRAPALFSRPTFKEMYEVGEKLISVDMAAGISQLRVAYDNHKLYHNHSAWSFVRWCDLSGVRNRSLKKAARYEDETPPRSDLPSREELEEISRRFSVKYLLAVMNSTLANNFLRANRRSNIHLYPDDWKKLPIAEAKSAQQALIAKLVDYVLFLTANPPADGDTLMLGYFEQIIDALVYELYLPGELHAADKRFFEPLTAERLPSLAEHEDDELRVVRKLFDRLSDVNHPVRKNLYFLDNLESIRIIEGK